MRLIILIVMLLLTSMHVSAQFYDNHWMMGYFGGEASAPTDSFGISILSFYDANLQIEDNQRIDLFFDGSGCSISD